MAVEEVTDDTFEERIIRGPLPSLVDFWASWCNPCLKLLPLLDQLDEQYAGRLSIYTMNVDENPVIPPKLGIRVIPTLVLYKESKLLERRSSTLSLSQLSDFLNSHL